MSYTMRGGLDERRGSWSDDSLTSEYWVPGQRLYRTPPPSYHSSDMTPCAWPDGEDRQEVNIASDESSVDLNSNGQSKADASRSKELTLKTLLKGLILPLHSLWTVLFVIVFILIFTQRSEQDDRSVHRNITNDDIDTLDKKINDLRADFKRLSNGVTNLSNDVRSFNATVSGINSMKQRIATLEQARAQEEKTTKEIVSRLSTLERLVAAIQAKIAKNGSATLKMDWLIVFMIALGQLIRSINLQ